MTTPSCITQRQRAQRLVLAFTVGLLALTALPAASAAAGPFKGFAPRITLPIGRNAHSVVTDDMNEDGHADLIVAVASADSVAVLAGTGGANGLPENTMRGHGVSQLSK